MRRLALALAAVLLPLAAAAAAVGLFLARPQYFLTSRTAGALLRRAAAAEGPSWTSLDFKAEPLGRGRHRYAAVARGLCFYDRRAALGACFDEVDVSVLVAYSSSGAALERVERLRARGRKIRLDLTRRRAPAAGGGGWVKILRSARWDGLSLELPSVEVVDSSGVTAGSLSALVAPGRRRPLEVTADLSRRSAGRTVRFQGEVSADTDAFRAERPTYLRAEAAAKWGKTGGAAVSASLRRGKPGEAFLVVKATATDSGRRLLADWSARREGRRAEGGGSLRLALSTGPVRGLDLSACRGTASLGLLLARPEKASVSCRYRLTAAPSLKLPGGAPAVEGELDASGRLEGRDGFRAEASATVEPLRDWYEVSGKVGLKAAGRLGAPLKTLKLAHEADVSLKVARFEELVALLKDTRFAVPAPFHVLTGPLELSAYAAGDPRAEDQSIRYRASADLKGRRQRLRADAFGRLDARRVWSKDRGAADRLEIVLKEATFELPRIDVASVPKVTSDPRVKGATEPVAAPAPPAPATAPAAARRGAPKVPAFPVTHRIRVRTESPAYLLSNLAREPVPAEADVTFASSTSPAAGTISLKKFDLELFRRTAVADHLNVVLKPGGGPGDLDGLLIYAAPAATIRIQITGTTAKPRVDFSSVPPLRPEDIIAVLIFGKSPDELDLDQTASVGNAQNALEGSAFGLATLYYFGVTPIERVAYDPSTKNYSVKLRLPGGLSAVIGSDFDRSRGLVLRKFLGPHLAVESEIGSQSAPTAPGATSAPTNSATTFLEWFKRY